MSLLAVKELQTPQSLEEFGLSEAAGDFIPRAVEASGHRSSRRPFPEVGRSFSTPGAPRDLSRSSCGCHHPPKLSALRV
ncbi:hypothetical protein CROQUDRAFT_102696 [Cronartium quercuum f. sp. fusiforme G11]|uniref:Uncharacterized protein n=1 Tax=Cronartium quercuum f. sp. fusiforme G11 TaxID=708437 RepID=A0A9P6T601_9BASI|nr:hypothetical protein CROQUDRAFT_102696 [Cronartium quercuum f. sp. fusiforme G11]